MTTSNNKYRVLSSNMPRLKPPFKYYWKKYMEGNCPFCNATILQTFENKDIVHCSAYGGYLVTALDSTYAESRDGDCKYCFSVDPTFRTVVEGQGFLCEDCSHGVYFDEQKVFQALFSEHDETQCKHCKWHNKRSPGNPVEKPSN